MDSTQERWIWHDELESEGREWSDLQRFGLAAAAFAVALAVSIVVWGFVLLAAGVALATIAQIVVFGLCIAVAGRLLF